MKMTSPIPHLHQHASRAAYTALIALLCVIAAAPLHASTCTAPATGNPDSKPVRLVFGGDIVLGNSFIVENIPKSWESQYFSGVREVLKNADAAIGNFEDTLTNFEKTSKRPGSGKQFAFRSPPHYAELLYQEGFKILNVANNHANDFGETGFKDTVKHMRQAGIAVAGLRDENAVLKVRDLEINVMGFTYLNRFNTLFDIEEAAERVRQAKAHGQYVIITFHAGAEGPAAIWHENAEEEFMGENRGNTVAFAHAMIDAGADLVVGHGPHVLRAAECYKDKPAVYSLGNFVGVGGLSAKSFAAVSALLEVGINPDGSIASLNLVPLNFNDQKLPQIDPREYGIHLINYLGQHARYAGNFIQFPVTANEDEKFAAWFRSNSPGMITARQ